MGRKLELGLTPRELQVARLVKEGLTDREIAGRLFIARRTAEWHLKQIFNKLGFSSRSQVAAWIAHDQAVGLAAGSSSGHRHNLPLQTTTFVGRGNDMVEIRRLLATRRLVTLTAVGGAGKTRLALEVAGQTLDSYPDGVWLVDLAPLKDGQFVARVFGSTLGIHERPRQPIAQTLIEHLTGRQLLLVVDNCEHVIEDCARLSDSVLHSCPGVTILATSREPLRVSGETVWRVPLLAVPDQAVRIDLLAQCEAVALFLDRAQLAAPSFEINASNAPAVAQLCRQLDGIPLAIELAAARAGFMSPEQILKRLEDRFGLLTGGSRAGPARHRTLQLALDWSHDLLSNEELQVFRRLSVFAGSFSLEAVEHVCSDNDLGAAKIMGLLGSLVDKSLVIAAGEVSAPTRFRMLETLKQYGRERLAESGEEEQLNRRHRAFFVALGEEAAPHLRGREQQAWAWRLAQDVGNLRAALEWSSGREPEANLSLSAALTDFWYTHGLIQEGDGWLGEALAGYAPRDVLRARALHQGALFSYWRGDMRRHSARANECLDIYRELGDQSGIGWGMSRVGQAAEWQGDLEKARMYYDRCLAISLDLKDASMRAHICRHLGRLALKEGRHDEAQTYLENSLAGHELSDDLVAASWTLGYLSLNAVETGQLDGARIYLDRALIIARDHNLTIPTSSTLLFYGVLAAAQSQPIRALRLEGASESLEVSVGAVRTRLTTSIVERWLDKSRGALGVKRSTSCVAEGRAMTLERATDYALKG
jgi:predicted ATPase/DNA-binding CsgD family transcriptional regulator